jgi:hypothetical protein
VGEDSRVDKGDKDKYGEEKGDDSKDEDENKNKDVRKRRRGQQTNY